MKVEKEIAHYEKSKTASIHMDVELDDKDKKIADIVMKIMFVGILVVFALVLLKILPLWTVFAAFAPLVIMLAILFVKYFVLKKGEHQIVATKTKTEIDGDKIKQESETTLKTPDGKLIEKEIDSFDNTKE